VLHSKSPFLVGCLINMPPNAIAAACSVVRTIYTPRSSVSRGVAYELPKASATLTLSPYYPKASLCCRCLVLSVA
jgi:hypothetical protein